MRVLKRPGVSVKDGYSSYQSKPSTSFTSFKKFFKGHEALYRELDTRSSPFLWVNDAGKTFTKKPPVGETGLFSAKSAIHQKPIPSPTVSIQPDQYDRYQIRNVEWFTPQLQRTIQNLRHQIRYTLNQLGVSTKEINPSEKQYFSKVKSLVKGTPPATNTINEKSTQYHKDSYSTHSNLIRRKILPHQRYVAKSLFTTEGLSREGVTRRRINGKVSPKKIQSTWTGERKGNAVVLNYNQKQKISLNDNVVNSLVKNVAIVPPPLEPIDKYSQIGGSHGNTDTWQNSKIARIVDKMLVVPKEFNVVKTETRTNSIKNGISLKDRVIQTGNNSSRFDITAKEIGDRHSNIEQENPETNISNKPSNNNINDKTLMQLLFPDSSQ